MRNETFYLNLKKKNERAGRCDDSDLMLWPWVGERHRAVISGRSPGGQNIPNWPRLGYTKPLNSITYCICIIRFSLHSSATVGREMKCIERNKINYNK